MGAALTPRHDTHETPFDPIAIPVGGSPGMFAFPDSPVTDRSQNGEDDAGQTDGTSPHEGPSVSGAGGDGSPSPPETVIPDAVIPDAVIPDLEAFFTRLFSTEVPDHVRRKSKDEVYAFLDSQGPGYYLEEIARGAIPVELAFRYELPVLYFMRWLQDRSDLEDYNYAMTLCADSLAAKSRAVLELSPDNAQEGMMIREYAKRALDLAERIAPDGWSSGKKPKNDGAAPPALQIAILLPQGADGKTQTIPGVELLARTPESGSTTP